MHTLFIVLLIIDCIALITVVLLQEGKSNGLSVLLVVAQNSYLVNKTTWRRFILA